MKEVKGSFQSLNKFVLYNRKIQETDLDSLIIVSGPKGVGKSTFSLQFHRRYTDQFGRYCPKCNLNYFFDNKERCPTCQTQLEDSNLMIEKHTAWDNDDVFKKIFKLAEGSPLICDEAVRFALGEDWNTFESKQLKKLFAQMRTKRLIVFFNLPSFRRLDSKYRNDYTTFWARVLDRGTAEIFQPDLGETRDPWHLKELEKAMGVLTYMTNIEKATAKLYKLPTFWDTVNFPKLPQRIYNKYRKLRHKKALEDPKKEFLMDQKDVAKFGAFNLYKNWGKILAAVEEARQNRSVIGPTYKIMEKLIFSDPKKEKKTVSYSTIRNWVNSVHKYIRI